MFRRLSLALVLLVLGYAHSNAQTAIQFGVNRGASPWTVCAYDSANICQTFLQLPSTGGGAYVPSANGGTGLTSPTGFLYFNGSSAPTPYTTLPPETIPAPTSSTLGGVFSAMAPSHQYQIGINTSGMPLFAQPIFSDISGTAGVSQGGTGATSFTVNAPLLGNGTSAFAQGTRSGTTTTFATSNGNLTSGHCVSTDTNHNFVDAGAPCGNSGTVTSITAGTGLSGGTVTTTGAFAVIYGTTAGTSAQGNDTRISGALQSSNNLSDLASAYAARANLGLGSVALTYPGAALSISGTSLNIASQASNTVLGNVAGSSAPPTALSTTQLTTLCNVFTSSLPGCVSASGGGTTKFLRADDTWVVIPTSGLQVVATQSALAALSTTGLSTGYAVYRAGYYAAHDGGEATYIFSTSACAAADTGAQVTGANGGCWITDIAQGANIQLWGGKPDNSTDNEPAFAAAIAAFNANGGGVINMPAATSCYRINSTVREFWSNVAIVGAGSRASCFDVNFATGAGVEFGDAQETITGSISGTTLTVTASTAGNIRPGLLIIGASIPNGTTITAYGTGTGNTGTYTISASLSIGSESITYFPFNPISARIEKVGFNSSAVTRTNGASIELLNTYNAMVRDIECLGNQYDCVSLDSPFGAPATNIPVYGSNQFDNHIDHIISFSGHDGICLGCYYGSSFNTWITNSSAYSQSNAGYDFVNAGGVFIQNLDTLNCLHGMYVHPNGAANGGVSAIYGGTTFFDSSTDVGMFWDTADFSGLVSDNHLHNVWVASCGSSGNPAPCVEFQGSSSMRGNVIDGIRVFSAYGSGVIINGLEDLQLSGEITQNGFAAANTYQGILACGVAASHWSWHGRIGGTTGSSYSNGYPQAVGVQIQNTTGCDYYIVEGDLSENLTAGLVDNANSAHHLTSQILQ